MESHMLYPDSGAKLDTSDVFLDAYTAVALVKALWPYEAITKVATRVAKGASAQQVAEAVGEAKGQQDLLTSILAVWAPEEAKRIHELVYLQDPPEDEEAD
jgi:hypothetical protein